MRYISYASAVDSLMYVQIYTRLVLPILLAYLVDLD